MPQLDTTAIQTIRLMQMGGQYHIPADSGSGNVYRPSVQGDRGGRVATPETLFDFFIDNVPLPSQALAQDPNFLTKLHQHPYVTSAMLKRCLTVAGFPWRIEANPRAPDQKFAKEVAEYAGSVWGQIPHIEQLYYQCIDEGALKGGIGFEFNYHKEASGVERPVEFNMVEMTRFVFDRMGNMALKTREYPVWGAYVSANLQKQYLRQFPRGKFMYHVHQKRPGTWENPGLEGYMYYGLGLDVALYIPVTFDSFVLRFRIKWLEKYGIPPTVLKHPLNEPIKGEAFRIADSLRGESVILMPWINAGDGVAGEDRDLYSVQQLEVPSLTNDAFHIFNTQWTKPCVNAIILGDPGENATADDAGGGYSERVTRRDSGLLAVARWDAMNISSTINFQIMPPLVLGRWPNLPPDYWPVHKLEPKEEKDRVQEAQILKTAGELGVEVAKDEAYERLGYRRPNATDEVIGGPQSGGMPVPGQSPPNGKAADVRPGGKSPRPGNADNTAAPPKGIGQGSGAGSSAVKQRTMPRM